MNIKLKLLLLSLSASLLFGCSSRPTYDIITPSNVKTTSIKTSHKNDACKMFKENPDWLVATNRSYQKWGLPISTQLSFVYHESSFVYNARPLAKRSSGYIFGKKYASSALGFSQALNGAWGDYIAEQKPKNASRMNFGDSVDFMGWYNSKSFKQLKIKNTDAYNLYLAYHEGRTGWKKGYHKKQKWLMNYAKKVQNKSNVYSKQINDCNLRLK